MRVLVYQLSVKIWGISQFPVKILAFCALSQRSHLIFRLKISDVLRTCEFKRGYSEFFCKLYGGMLTNQVYALCAMLCAALCLYTTNKCWPTRVRKLKLVCERHNNKLANCWRQIELVSVLANFFPTCCCVVYTQVPILANTN